MTANLRETEALLECVTPWQGTVPAGYDANFLGTVTAVLFLAHCYPKEMMEAALAGPRHLVAARPRVTDGEAYFEGANVIRSVLQARGRYVMVELGGGYGARAVDCAVALRRLNPVKPFFVLVEPLPTYIDWADHHFRANGVSPQEHWLLNAIVSERPVPECMYLHPRGFGNQVNDPSIAELLDKTIRDAPAALAFGRALVEAGGVRLESGGVLPDSSRRRPTAYVDPTGWTVAQMQAEAIVGQESAQLGFVSALTLADILRPLDRVDFMDVDIQFAEIRVIPPHLDLLQRKVKLLSIGTHSLDIHDQLSHAFDPQAWELLVDFAPWSTHETSLGTFKTQDGVLTVLNRSLE